MISKLKNLWKLLRFIFKYVEVRELNHVTVFKINKSVLINYGKDSIEVRDGSKVIFNTGILSLQPTADTFLTAVRKLTKGESLTETLIYKNLVSKTYKWSVINENRTVESIPKGFNIQWKKDDLLSIRELR